jgi:tetratricopeptide (TPR) repeat protein
LTDTLVTRLGSFRSIVVRPVSNAGAAPDAIEIGRKLEVDAVLEAPLQRTDRRLRVNARLLRVSDGALLWAASFDENETDLFKLQDELSLQVTQSLGTRLNPKEAELLTKHDTQDRAAFHDYWRGRLFLEKRNPEKAIAEFQQAINLDPNYALAYTGLADAYMWQASFTSDADAELYRKAKASTNKALELNPNLADAHSALGRIKYSHDWDWAGAEKSFQRAIELNPNSVNAHQFYARLLTTLGRYDEGITEINKARELDPRSADLGVPLYGILEKQREYDAALKVLQSTLEMDNDSQFARRGTAKLYLLKGDYAKVIELGDKLFANPRETDFAWASMLATAYHKSGDISKAVETRNHLKQLAKKDPKSLYFLALHYSELGRTDEAFAALQTCLELREDRMLWTKDEPRFSAIEDDPRFQEILQKLKLAS